MNGTDLILRGEGQTIAAATRVVLELQQEAERFELLPGTATEEEEMWEYYRPGKKSWSLKHQGLYCMEMAEGFTTNIMRSEDCMFRAHIVLQPRPLVELLGTVHLQDVSISANCDALSKFNATLLGDDFPDF